MTAGPASFLVTRTLVVSGGQVRVGDVIAVGGNGHTVVDVREVHPARKRLAFADGNTYVLARGLPVEVRRTVEVRRVGFRPSEGGRRPGPGPGAGGGRR